MRPLADFQAEDRDNLTDAGRQGAPTKNRDPGEQIDPYATTLGNEIGGGGWLNITEPVGGEPADVCTAGSRGSTPRPIPSEDYEMPMADAGYE